MITNNRYTNPKVRLLSDLHMEGGRFNYEYLGEDIVILAGDIHTRGRHGELLDQIPKNVQILMVAGNHEFYHSEFKYVTQCLKSLEDEYENLKFLNNETFVYNDIYFYGGTMFSDFLLYKLPMQKTCELVAEKGINDFRIIYGYWDIKQHKEQHKVFSKGLKKFQKLAGNNKQVVISHFCPSPGSIDSRYGNDPLNAYFTSDMEKYMGFNGYWFHGHTHSSFYYSRGDTKVICNPKGYGTENKEFDPNMIIELVF